MWLVFIDVLLLSLAEICAVVSPIVLCWHLAREKLTADSAQWSSTIPVVVCLTVILAVVIFATSKFVIKRKAIRDFEAAHGALDEDTVRIGFFELFRLVAVIALLIWALAVVLMISRVKLSDKQMVDLGIASILWIPALLAGAMITGSSWYMSGDAAVIFVARTANRVRPVAGAAVEAVEMNRLIDPQPQPQPQLEVENAE